MVNWRLEPRSGNTLPSASQRSLPDASHCELCGDRARTPLSTVVVIDGPDGLPVPFLICAHCRRSLSELHGLLTTAEGKIDPLSS